MNYEAIQIMNYNEINSPAQFLLNFKHYMKIPLLKSKPLLFLLVNYHQ